MDKKILFVNSSLSDGGSERVMCLLANQFAKLDYSVEMILVRDCRKDTYEIDSNIKLVRCNYKMNNKLFKLISRIFKIRREIKKNDYVVSFMSDINLCTLMAGIGLHKKIIVSERADPANSGRSKFQFFLERRLYPMAHKVVLQTEYVKKYFSDKIVNKSVVISNPIASDIPKRNFKNINNTIVAAGRLNNQKNFKLLIDAFSKFNEINSNYSLVIYGDGPLKNELMEQIKSLNLENKVSLPGYVKNVNELMKDCYIFVSTSNYEGISNSMLEAMAMGIPSVCTDCPVGGARMMINNKKNGILVPVGDKKKIIEAIKLLTTDRKLYDSISKEALKINNEYSIDIITNQWIDIL